MASCREGECPLIEVPNANHGIYRERDSQGVEKSHIFAWTRPPRVMEALRQYPYDSRLEAHK
jgi:hypothetical protein